MVNPVGRIAILVSLFRMSALEVQQASQNAPPTIISASLVGTVGVYLTAKPAPGRMVNVSSRTAGKRDYQLLCPTGREPPESTAELLGGMGGCLALRHLAASWTPCWDSGQRVHPACARGRILCLTTRSAHLGRCNVRAHLRAGKAGAGRRRPRSPPLPSSGRSRVAEDHSRSAACGGGSRGRYPHSRTR